MILYSALSHCSSQEKQVGFKLAYWVELKILGWCPAGSVLPHGEKVPSLALVGHPSSDGVTIRMPYGVDVLHQPVSHPIFSYWVGSN